MRDKLTRQTIPLTPREWSFRIDPDNQGLERGWHMSHVPDPSEWKPMRIGKHWESLGYPALDGWAWYRIDVELPEDWRSREIHVWVDGGDDYFEVYADGEKIGSAGDIETKATAFEERVSFAVPLAKQRLADVTSLSLAIRVYDWYGSGGLFRPIQLSTSPRRKSLEILR
jgi:beta-galactosidase/beta-glucuronidase